jgi:hypothetical protein
LERLPEKRPYAEHIIEMLVETESTDECTELDETESVDEFTEPDAKVSSFRVMQVTKPLPEFGHITLITIVHPHGSKLKLHTILFDLRLSLKVSMMSPYTCIQDLMLKMSWDKPFVL